MRRIAFSLLVALSTATADTESSDADVTNLLQLINPQGPLPAQTGAQSQLYGSKLQELQRADFASTKWSSQSTPALNAEDSKPIIMTGRFGNLPPAVKNSGVTSQVSSQSSLLKQAVPVQAPTSLTSPTQPTQSLGSVASLAKLAELAELARLSSTKPRVREARVTGTAHKKGKKEKKLKREPEDADVELPKKSTELVPELSSEEVEPEPAEELSSSKVKTSKSKNVLTDAAVSQASHGGAKRLHDLAAAACKDWLRECRSISTDFNVDACMHYKSFCIYGTPGLIEGSAMAVGQADHAVSKMAADIMGAPTQSPKKSAETADAAATAPSQADTVESKTLGDGISTGISQSGVGGFGTDREPETAPTASTESTESTDRVEEISKDALSPITEAEAAEVRKQGSEELENLDESDESSDPQPEGLDAKTTSSTNAAEASADEAESSSDVHELKPEVPATPEPSEFLDSGSAESDADTEEPSAAAETLESDQLDQPQVRPEAPLLSSTDSTGSTHSTARHTHITHSSISRSDRSDISDSPGTAKPKPMSNAGWVFGQAASTLTNNQEVDQGIQSTTFALSRVDALGASAGSLTLAQSEQEQERLASAKENLCALWHSMCRRVTTAEVCVKYASICH